MAVWDDLPAAGGFGECAALVGSAEALRFSAPELAVQLARRALVVGATAHRDKAGDKAGDKAAARTLSMRAQAVLTAGLVRTSRYVDAVEPGFAALALAEHGGVSDVATAIRLDLATCSREVGEPLLGCSLLRPVLDAAQLRPSVRAMAFGRLVACAWHVTRRDDVEDALAEAEQLLAEDEGLSPDARCMERAWLSERAAAYYRWYGDVEDAAEAARDGLRHLERLSRRRPDADRLRAQLVLELVLALLDDGDLNQAMAESEVVFVAPVRATSAGAVGQLMLAMSTRVHLPAGRVGRGRVLLDQAVQLADRHGLDGLLADALTAVSQLDERADRPSDALEALRAARAAEERRLRGSARASRLMLTGTGTRDWDAHAVNSLLRKVLRPARQAVEAPTAEPAAVAASARSAGDLVSAAIADAPEPASIDEPAYTDDATGLLNREGLFRRLRAVRNGERPVTLMLVRFENDGAAREDSGGPGRVIDLDLGALAGRVRDIAPDDAELARPDGAELAVLLPHTTWDQAERFTAAVREKAVGSGWLERGAGRSVSTGAAQSNPHVPAVDARALLTAARHALTPTKPTRDVGPGTAPPAGATTQPDTSDLAETLRIGDALLSSLTASPTAGGTHHAAPTTDERHEEATELAKNEAAESRPPGRPSSYEQTRAELARMMSSLTAGDRPRSATNAPADHGAPAGPAHREPAAAPAHSAPTTPSPHDEPTATEARAEPTGATYTEPTATAHSASAAARRALDDATGSAYSKLFAMPNHGEPATAARDEPAHRAPAAGLTFPISTPIPTPIPTQPAGDRPRNGASSPRLSIPTPPEPNEVPEPPRRPDVPEPGEPDPIPPTPPDQPDAPTPSDTSGGRSWETALFGRHASDPTNGAVPNGALPNGAVAPRGTREPKTAEPSTADSAATEPAGRRERRGERSFGSTTIAGLLAEALAAYQETAEEEPAEQPARRNGGSERSLAELAHPRADQDGPAHHWSRTPQPEVSAGQQSRADQHASVDEQARAGQQTSVSDTPIEQPTSADHAERAESSGFADFDRLFDWRSEFPASGRHRSPE